MAITMDIATVNYLMAMFRLSMPYMRMDSPTLPIDIPKTTL